MVTKFEEIIKSLKELQIYAESCNKDTIEKTSSISSIIERSFSRNEITVKDGIGTELRQILSKYKYI